MKSQVFLSDEATKDLEQLDLVQRRKLQWWAGRLATDFDAGDHIRAELVPARLVRRYRLSNLCRFELPGGWRALYTVVSHQGEPVTVSIVRILDHKAYDRLFGYKRS